VAEAAAAAMAEAAGSNSSAVLSVAFPCDKLFPVQHTSLFSIIIHSLCYLQQIAAYCSQI